jgi:hypothetical protein
MYSHLTEVVAEARLHVGPRPCVERLAGRMQHIMDDLRSMCCHGILSFLQYLPLQCLFFVPARGTLFERSARLLLDRWLRHPHHRLCHAIGFTLVLVVRISDGQLGLEQRRL